MSKRPNLAVPILELFFICIKMILTQKSQSHFKELWDKYIKECYNSMIMVFAPDDGICYDCNQVIYNDEEITQKMENLEMITRCPLCNTSYTD
jgi:hypothetical protein